MDHLALLKIEESVVLFLLYRFFCLRCLKLISISFHIHYLHIYIYYTHRIFLFCLGRELNELRKPSSDNIEILRFFRYMRAAKDGQDGNNCQDIYSKCTEFNANDGPAMINTYNDINKLVQARKF